MVALPAFRGANLSNSGNILVYKDFGLAYNRIKKSGNTFTRHFLQENLRETHSTSGPRTVGLSRVWKWNELQDFSHYFFFTVVRNPYTRLLSAYLDKSRLAKSVREYREIPGFETRGPVGFAQFVDFLADEGTSSNSHWYPQQALLFLPAHKQNKIVRLENFEESMIELLASLDIKIDSDHLRAVPPSAHENCTGSAKLVSEFYNDRLLSRVFGLYESDFESFGYDERLPVS